jgi:NADH-quinone oxidoreductase subunit J
MNMTVFLFWVIAGMTGACAIATVVTHNIVRAATWLLFTLGGASALFFLIGADLVGAIQLLVYVGGTLVLVVFGVMLTAQGPFISMRTSSAEWGVSAATGIALLAVLLLATFPHVPLGPPAQEGAKAPEPVVAFAPKPVEIEPRTSPFTMIIGQGFTGVGVGPAHRDPNARPKLAEAPKVPASGQFAPDVEPAPMPAPEAPVMRTHYLLPFEIVSIHLLVVLIGAAYLALTKRRREEVV